MSAASRDAAGQAPAAWSVWVDTGGTFTDCVAVDPMGRVSRGKVLSTSALRSRITRADRPDEVSLALGDDIPGEVLVGCTLRVLPDGAPRAVSAWDPVTGAIRLGDPLDRAPAVGDMVEIASGEEAPVFAARLATATPSSRPLPPMAMRLGTTRGTNALLEGHGAPVALFVTRGFADLLEIGTQQRDELFTLRITKRSPLPAIVVEVDERRNADGSVLRPVDLEQLRRDAATVRTRGIEAAAVALLHAWRDDGHERAVAATLREVGFTHVSRSAELVPRVRILARAETAAIDATLAPVVGRYLERVAGALAGGTLHVMTSAGGLVRAERYAPKDSLLSGPAGGVVGAAAAGMREGFSAILGFDMGGTSTDVSRFDGDYEYVFEHRVGPAVLAAPAVGVETVAAGGGSVCRFDGQRLLVGPESAGADPGPACYGAGGPMTMTDVNLLLGRLDPDRFGIPVDSAAARRALKDVTRAMAFSGPDEAVLAGWLEIADERMAEAIRRISLRRGYDPGSYALVAFGGAGPQHACAVAEMLGVAAVVIPEDAGLLSAVGLGQAVIERFVERQVLAPLEGAARDVGRWLEELAADARALVRDEGVDARDVIVRRRIAGLRLLGQDTSVLVEVDDPGALPDRFASAYEALYGYPPPRRPVELESLRVVASTRPVPVPVSPMPTRRRAPRPDTTRRAWFSGGWQEVAVFHRGGLRPGDTITGPALVLEPHAASVVGPRWTVRVGGSGALVLARQGASGA